MNKYLCPLVCAIATGVIGICSASVMAPSSVHPGTHLLWYFQEDDDSGVQTDSDSTGDYDVFYDRLAPEGRWFNDDDYGYVWQPNVAVSETSWRPYSDGHWVWTDRGWFWDSNEDFGWATYHYGRWAQVEGTGWVWVPGQHWAPAWVSWRHTDNDDYLGWAPLPPESSFNVNVGVHPWCDNYYDIGPIAFAFIRIADFGRPSYREFCLPPQQNLGFFNRTTNITNITYNNNVINNYGPEYQRVTQLVQQKGGQQIPNYRLNFAAQGQANAAFKTSAQGNQLNVVAPPQSLKPMATVRPQVAKELGKAQVDRGWRNVPEPQAQQFRQQFVQQSPVPKNLPAKPAPLAKPQIQEVTKGQPHPPNEPGKTPPAPGGQLKPFVEQSPKNVPGKPAPSAKPQTPEVNKGEQHPPNEPGRTPTAPGGQSKPVVEQSPAQKNVPGKPELPAKPQTPEVNKGEQHIPNETGKAQPPGGQLKPLVQNPAGKPTEKAAGEPRKVETEKAQPVQPENVKPPEPPRKPPVVTEERKAGTEPAAPEKPRTQEAPKGEAEHAPQNHAREAVKPGEHEEAQKHKKEDPKKEPPPQR